MALLAESSVHFDAIVLGAGLGGLSAAAHLAALGKRTLLLEKYAVLGGCSHVFRRKRQWEFDVGVHYIGDCGPGGQVSTLLRGLGLADRIEWLPMDRDGFDTIIAPDFELKVPNDWDQFLENVIRAFPNEERGLRRYIGTLRRIGAAVDRSVTPASTAGQAKAAFRAGTAAAWMMAPVSALQDACGLSGRAAHVLSLHLGAVATTPDVAPVALLAGFFQNYIAGGAWYPRGGGQVLAAGFAEVIRSHGGTIRTQTSAKRIMLESGAVTGVELADGQQLRAPVVVSGIDINRTYRELVGYENLPRTLRLRDAHWKMSWPLINAFFGVEIDGRTTPNSNFYAVPTWAGITTRRSARQLISRTIKASPTRDPVEWAKDFVAHQPAFVQCSTRRDPSNLRSAPKGHAAIEVQTLAPFDARLWGFDGHDVASGRYRKDARYQAIKEIVTQGMLERAEQVFPSASTKVRWSELATPATQERYTSSTNGSAFGLEPRISQFGPLRPGTRTPIRGLFLVGTSTAWGPGTEGSMLSGLHAASAISGRDLQTETRHGAILADPSRLSAWPADFDPLAASRLRSPDSDEQSTALRRPRGVQVTYRRVSFPFESSGFDRYWHGGSAFKSLFWAQLSTSFEVGEKFFIDSARALKEHVKDEALLDEMNAFCKQEGHHTFQHLKFDRMNAAHGIATAMCAARYSWFLNRARRLDPLRMLAVTVALEHFTATLAQQYLSQQHLTEGADPNIDALWRWHAVEETEHKATCYDIYRAADGNYTRRVVTLPIAWGVILGVSLWNTVSLLRAERRLFTRDTLSGLRYLFGLRGLVTGLVPAFLSYFSPRWHPWQDNNAEQIERWVQNNQQYIEQRAQPAKMPRARATQSRRPQASAEVPTQAVLAGEST